MKKQGVNRTESYARCTTEATNIIHYEDMPFLSNHVTPMNGSHVILPHPYVSSGVDFLEMISIQSSLSV